MIQKRDGYELAMIERFHDSQMIMEPREYHIRDGAIIERRGCSIAVYIPKIDPWSGPKDGLPPVGTVFEFTSNDGRNWRESEILFVDSQIVLLRGYELFKLADPDINFRLVRTPEQVAADLRDKASVELAGILSGHDQHVTVRDIEMAKYLYDIGYRKFEITDDSDPA